MHVLSTFVRQLHLPHTYASGTDGMLQAAGGAFRCAGDTHHLPCGVCDLLPVLQCVPEPV